MLGARKRKGRGKNFEKKEFLGMELGFLMKQAFLQVLLALIGLDR